MKLRNLITQEIRQAIHDELADDRLIGVPAICEYLGLSRYMYTRLMKRYEHSNPLPLIRMRLGPVPRRIRVWTTKPIAYCWMAQVAVAEQARKAAMRKARKGNIEKGLTNSES